MLEYCKLRPDGRVVDHNDQDLEERVFWVMEDLEVRLSPGVTLESVFRLLGTYPDHFALALGCPHLPALLTEAIRPTEQLLETGAIGIRRRVEVIDKEVFVGFDVNAVILGQDGKYTRDGSVELCPANELAGLPLWLDTSFVIEEHPLSRNRYVGEADFTLRDVLRALVEELTWHGSPSDRDQFAQGLVDAAKESNLVRDPDVVEEIADKLFGTRRRPEG